MGRIILIGCGKQKLEGEHPAKDLYTGSLFRSRRTYAENQGDLWFIISAKHGLLEPSRTIKSYDVSIDGFHPLDRAAWFVGVASQILERLDDSSYLDDRMMRQTAFEIHAGAAYSERLIDVLRSVGFSAACPVANLSQGEQMAWYARQRNRDGRLAAAAT